MEIRTLCTQVEMTDYTAAGVTVRLEVADREDLLRQVIPREAWIGMDEATMRSIIGNRAFEEHARKGAEIVVRAMAKHDEEARDARS